jgi:hypothetical protein
MNEQIKQKWIEALNSGEYLQTKGCLNDGQGMCCLGVLTDLYIKENGGKWKLSDYGVKAGVTRYALDAPGGNPNEWDEAGVLTSIVRDWAGLKEPIPLLPFIPRDEDHNSEDIEIDEDKMAEYHESVAGANDAGISFPQIADLIKAFL